MAGADGHRQGVYARALDELHRLVGVGEVNLSASHVVLDATSSTELALDRDAPLVRHLDDLPRYAHVVLEVGWSLGVFHQGTVHHDTREAEVYGAVAGLGRGAVVLVQSNRYLRIDLRCRLHEVVEEAVVGVLARSPGGLDDDR